MVKYVTMKYIIFAKYISHFFIIPRYVCMWMSQWEWHTCSLSVAFQGLVRSQVLWHKKRKVTYIIRVLDVSFIWKICETYVSICFEGPFHIACLILQRSGMGYQHGHWKSGDCEGTAVRAVWESRTPQAVVAGATHSWHAEETGRGYMLCGKVGHLKQWWLA